VLSAFIYNSVLFDSAFVLFIIPCLFARAVVSASLPNLSHPLLYIHCFCCIVPFTNIRDDDDDDDDEDFRYVALLPNVLKSQWRLKSKLNVGLFTAPVINHTLLLILRTKNRSV